MKFKTRLKAALVGLSTAFLLGAPAQAQTVQINGAGATFPFPIYSKWFDEYHKMHPNVEINYQSIGSGGGIRQLSNETVFFGASDGPMTNEQLAAAPGAVLHLPTVLGGDVPVYNIPGVSAELKFTGPVLADVFLGKITKWNDPAVTALNPGVPLPDAAISTVRRADGSGTTYIFTDYLSKVNPEWKTKVGVGTAVNWPNGAGGKGNEGVSSFVQRLPNSIGYVEYAYARQNKMAFVMMKNSAGNFVPPDADNVKAAAAGADWAKSFYQMLTDQPGKAAWPISGATFVMMHRAQDKPVNAANTLKFFDWSFAHGDGAAADLDYVTLPDAVKALVRKEWSDDIKDAAGKTVAYQ